MYTMMDNELLFCMGLNLMLLIRLEVHTKLQSHLQRKKLFVLVIFNPFVIVILDPVLCIIYFQSDRGVVNGEIDSCK